MKTFVSQSAFWVSFLCLLSLASYTPVLEAQGQATINLGGSKAISLSGNWSESVTTRRTEIRTPASSEPQVLIIDETNSESKGLHLNVNPYQPQFLIKDQSR